MSDRLIRNAFRVAEHVATLSAAPQKRPRGFRDPPDAPARRAGGAVPLTPVQCPGSPSRTPGHTPIQVRSADSRRHFRVSTPPSRSTSTRSGRAHDGGAAPSGAPLRRCEQTLSTSRHACSSQMTENSVGQPTSKIVRRRCSFRWVPSLPELRSYSRRAQTSTLSSTAAVAFFSVGACSASLFMQAGMRCAQFRPVVRIIDTVPPVRLGRSFSVGSGCPRRKSPRPRSREHSAQHGVRRAIDTPRPMRSGNRRWGA